ncbi:oligosaccharide flippase family protein [Cognatiyoonia koreensis]|uniref:oligosaccharide flippase family protein n=1 Tax=Cognatiyoonia koreensis TaxID=364200 RepID=UPI0013F4C5C0|nr:oligosaccharide flippase family protein [Cognatiyoonia koreensis]
MVSTIVLTRLLAPEIYGVFAVVLVYLYFLEMISDLGLRSLVLTREGEVTDVFLKTCWTISILRGGVILLFSMVLSLVFLIAQNANLFAQDSPYSASVLPPAIVCIGFAALIQGFETPMRFMSEREMAFGRLTAVDLARNVVTLAVTIALAFYLRSVWALVIGQIFRSVIHVILNNVVFPGPKLAFCLDRESIRVLISRGKWVLGQSTLTVLSQSFDRIFLGFVMTSTTFGFYYTARQLVDLVPQFLQALNNAVILQVFRKLHESTPEDFRRNYYRYRLVLDGAAGLVAGGLIIAAPLFVDIIFDDRYAGVAPIMQILSLSILIFGLNILQNAFNAQHRFDVVTKLSIISVLSLVGGLAFATFVLDSVTAALFVVALHRLPEAIVVTYMGHRRGWVVLWREGIIIAVFALGALLGWGVVQLAELVFWQPVG